MYGYNHISAPVSPNKIPTISIQRGLAGEININRKKIAPITKQAHSIKANTVAFPNFIMLNYFAGLPQPGQPSQPIEQYLLYKYINSI